MSSKNTVRTEVFVGTAFVGHEAGGGGGGSILGWVALVIKVICVALNNRFDLLRKWAEGTKGVQQVTSRIPGLSFRDKKKRVVTPTGTNVPV